MTFRDLRETLLDVLFPAQCVVCGRTLVSGERYMCLHCDAALPRLSMRSMTDNEIHRRLMAKDAEIDRAVSLMAYRRESPFARVIQTAKYGHRPGMCRHLGRRLATTAAKSGFFDGIDLIVPVPMPVLKKLRRGYNQSEEIARGIADATGLPWADDCLRARLHSTQTRKSASERLDNASRTYYLPHPDDWNDVRHILLVDDVITTGATMLACARHLHRAIPGVKVSVASVALTALA